MNGIEGARRSWYGMKQRCLNPNATGYIYWGGSGVTICPRWMSFQLFLKDMGPRPEGKSIDRWPDPCGNYEPNNCRWANQSEQNINKRPRETSINQDSFIDIIGAAKYLRDARRQLRVDKEKLTLLIGLLPYGKHSDLPSLLKITPQYLSDIKNGRRAISDEVVERLVNLK